MTAIATVTLAACGSGSEGKWQDERDSIMNVNEQQQQVLDDLTASLVEVSASLDSIAAGEGLLKSQGEGPVLTKQQMLENLATFKSTLQENKARLAKLEKQLSERNDQLSKLSTLVKHLNAELEAKEARINELEADLSKANANIEQLRGELSTMTTTVSTLQDENESQRQTIESQTSSLNTGYYIIGTSKDLKSKGIVTGGGLLKKKKVNYESFDQSLFVKIDTRTTTQLTIPSKKVKVLTGAPSDSYTVTTNGNSSVLQITNVERFWGVSRYLIIEAD